MAGLYIHIPFCNSKCAYCGFYSIPSLKLKESFLAALRKDITYRSDYLQGAGLNTVYFGGGTPSLLSSDEIAALLDSINHYFPIATDAEITLEANPDTLSQDYLAALRKIGINRLSIGIQSFFDNDLHYLNRRHDSKHARLCIDWAFNAGFDNISIDLIYGLPTSDVGQWNRNLDLFFQTGAPHLSAYALTLEPNTILSKLVEQNKTPSPTEEAIIRDYETLTRRTAEHSFLHYEISNFALPQKHSRHNVSYWNGTPYMGLGPSAHSYNGNSRQWNIANLQQYIRLAGVSDAVFEKEMLTPEQHYDEYVMTSLRTSWGCDLKYMKRKLGPSFSDYCQQKAEKLIQQGRLSHTREFLHLTDMQMLFADGIAQKLFWEE